jgi:hypothetical protein
VTWGPLAARCKARCIAAALWVGAFSLVVYDGGRLPLESRALARLLVGLAVPVVLGAALQVASLAVTLAVNIPLNTALDAADPDDADDVVRAREAFERPWNRAHAVRTVLTAVGAVALLV